LPEFFFPLSAPNYRFIKVVLLTQPDVLVSENHCLITPILEKTVKRTLQSEFSCSHHNVAELSQCKRDSVSFVVFVLGMRVLSVISCNNQSVSQFTWNID
jgi:hypothetical protein